MNKFNEIVSKNIESGLSPVCDFSQSVAFSHFNYLSAQLPVDINGKLINGGIKDQAIQVFKNIELITKNVDHNMDDVVKFTIYVKNIVDVTTVREIYKSYYSSYIPTITIVVAKDIPMNALVQVATILSNGKGTIPNAPQSGELVKLPKLISKCGSCNQSVGFSHYNYLSAQFPINKETGKIVEGGIKEQLRQGLLNVKSVLENIDCPFDDIVKVNIYVTDLKCCEEMKEVYSTFFPGCAIARAINYLPALSIIEVKEVMFGALVQVETVISYGHGTPPQAVEDRHNLVIEFNNVENVFKNPLSTQSVAFSHYNHISAQLPLDANSSQLVSNDFEAQVVKCLENIQNIVESIDHKIEDVVILNILVKDIKNVDLVSKVIKTFFNGYTPAGTIIEVANISKDALVQIDAVVANAEGTLPVRN